jgi:hypothetical protein
MLFQTGLVVQTAGIAAESRENPRFALYILNSLNRHKKGDWGDLGQEDKDLNNQAIKGGDRILSAYLLPTREGTEKIYIITEHNRSVTTVLFASEY